MSLYLLHFDVPLGDPRRPRISARHYLGYAESGRVIERVALHRRGEARCAITQAAHRQGIGVVLVAVLPGTRDDERRRKRNGHHDRLCVLCTDSKQRERWP